MFMKKFWAAFLAAFIVWINPAAVFAADAWGIAAQALGVFAAYKSALIEMLKIGNNALYQTASLEEHDVELFHYYLMRILFTGIENPQMSVGEIMAAV